MTGHPHSLRPTTRCHTLRSETYIPSKNYMNKQEKVINALEEIINNHTWDSLSIKKQALDSLYVIDMHKK